MDGGVVAGRVLVHCAYMINIDLHIYMTHMSIRNPR